MLLDRLQTCRAVSGLARTAHSLSLKDVHQEVFPGTLQHEGQRLCDVTVPTGLTQHRWAQQIFAGQVDDKFFSIFLLTFIPYIVATWVRSKVHINWTLCAMMIFAGFWWQIEPIKCDLSESYKVFFLGGIDHKPRI